jgi:hypothetical protein
MASYWRALSLAGVLSLIAGGYEYVKILPPALTPIWPILSAAFAAFLGTLVTFSAVTTLQAIWYLVRRQKGTAGWLLITAGAPPAFSLVMSVIGSFVTILTDPAHPLDIFRDNVGEAAPYMLFPAAWIAGGIWLIRLDRRQRLVAGIAIPEVGPNKSGKWPPLPG